MVSVALPIQVHIGSRLKIPSNLANQTAADPSRDGEFFLQIPTVFLAYHHTR